MNVCLRKPILMLDQGARIRTAGNLQELVALFDEKDAVNCDRSICIRHIILRAQVAYEKGENREKLRFRQLNMGSLVI